ncbi:MAG: hypothetical protein ACYSX0_22815 [Planctomycetota bacterium]
MGAGALTACVALSKQTLGTALAAGLVVSTVATAPVGMRLRQSLGLVAGGISVALVTVGFYGARGDLAALVENLVTLPMSFGNSYALPPPNLWPPGELAPGVDRYSYFPQVHTLLHGGEPTSAPITLLTQALFALPFVALSATLIRRCFGPLCSALWMQTGLLLALTWNLYPRSDWGHLVVTLPLAAAQLAVLLRGLTERSAWIRLVAWAAGALVLVLAASDVVVGRSLHALAGRDWGPRVPQRFVGGAPPATAKVIDYLRERVEPGEPIFVARAEPLLYFATDTRNPTPYPGLVPSMQGEQERTIVKALEQVRFLVMSDLDSPTYGFYRDELPAVQAYLERHYRVAEAFRGEGESRIAVLERGPDRGPTATDLIRAEDRATRWTLSDSGEPVPVTGHLPRLATVQNRRPLPMLIGPRGGGIDYSIEIPAGAVFQVAVGFELGLGSQTFLHPSPCRLLVLIRRRSGRFRQLISARIERGRGTRTEWIPLEADLAAYAGERVTLRLQLIPDHLLSPSNLAWWGSPRIAISPTSQVRERGRRSSR